MKVRISLSKASKKYNKFYCRPWTNGELIAGRPGQYDIGMAAFSGQVHGRWCLGRKEPRFKQP